MNAVDLHDKRMLVKIAEGRGKPQKRIYENTPSGRRALLAEARRHAKACGGARVVFAYEASGQGFGLYDEIRDAGLECFVLAPTKISRSPQHRKSKTDEKDAERILEILRGYILAGNDLPEVWVPDPHTREDREVVRARLDVAEKLSTLKAQVQTLLKRNGLRRPSRLGDGWTNKFYAWLRGLLRAESALPYGVRVGLGTLLRQMEALDAEVVLLDHELQALAETERYAEPARALDGVRGVGLLTAMVYLTEMGDLSRFTNRKQVGAFLGLAPSSNESGESEDRKGHITHQGNWRTRRVLCQCSWAIARTDPAEKAVYQRIVAKNPKHKKIAVVAIMRRLAVRLWHIGLDAQRKTGAFLPKRLEAVG
jgi:transposase